MSECAAMNWTMSSGSLVIASRDIAVRYDGQAKVMCTRQGSETGHKIDVILSTDNLDLYNDVTL